MPLVMQRCTAANSFISSAGSIASVGAVPVLADIRENIDPNLLRRILKKTKAIMPAHLLEDQYWKQLINQQKSDKLPKTASNRS